MFSGQRALVSGSFCSFEMNWQKPPFQASLAIRNAIPWWNVFPAGVVIEGSMKDGPSNWSWRTSLDFDETGHCAPVPVLPVPTRQVSVKSLQTGVSPLNSPLWIRQFEVAKEVPCIRVWYAACVKAVSLT